MTPLERTQHIFGWPSPEDITNPSGAGPAVLASLARDKVGAELNRLLGGHFVEVGLLLNDAETTETQAPIALVCSFSVRTSESILRLAHRLAWNFCKAPLLITLEPGLARAWTCCEQPASDRKDIPGDPEITDARTEFPETLDVQEVLSAALHWISLSSGEFFRQRPQRFSREGRADEQLVKNLKAVRDLLVKDGLSHDTTHDLLARLIFAQFLFDRKDSNGEPALSASKLAQLNKEGIFSQSHNSLENILTSYEDTYSFFRWLDKRFNGDLFPHAMPGEDTDPWAAEMNEVKESHLKTLANFVSGSQDIGKGQAFLWRLYSFDTIPLEFISSIYEAFVRDTLEGNSDQGIVYTPSHLVDYVLDAVIPWGGSDWDIRVLDPACGSGIFLVKAFQRIIHRWRLHHQRSPKPEELANILEHNLFGVDTNAHATRVASFSLYLAMCDEIDPRSYWESVTFPQLRSRTLAVSDFFALESGLFIESLQGSFDIVVGNPPWGANTSTPLAALWSKRNDWPVSYKDIGPLFLPRSLEWTKPGGAVALLQPVSLLTKHGTNPSIFRKRIFQEWRVHEVTNFAACRFGLFKSAVGPACLVVLTNEPTAGDTISYICPKPRLTAEDEFQLSVEPSDISFVFPLEATSVSVWTCLMWGGRRDLGLLKKLRALPSLSSYESSNRVITRWGLLSGDQKKPLPDLDGRPLLASNDFPDGTFLDLKPNDLPKAHRVFVHSKDSPNSNAFRTPQLIIKHRWSKERMRWRSASVLDPDSPGIICSRNYISVHSSDVRIIRAANMVMNSQFSLYYLLLTSYMAFERPVPTVGQILSVPLPEPSAIDFDRDVPSLEEVDKIVNNSLGLKSADCALIEDFLRYTVPDYAEGRGSAGRQPTLRGDASQSEPDIRLYAEFFIRVLKAGFGSDKSIAATIFAEHGLDLPFRAIGFHLDGHGLETIVVREISSQDLINELRSLDLSNSGPRTSKAISFSHMVRIYGSATVDNVRRTTVYIVKPDMRRFWTRSAALRDADEVSADIATWSESPSTEDAAGVRGAAR